jgi:hypothetical protein
MMIGLDFECFYREAVEAGIAGPMPYIIIPFGAQLGQGSLRGLLNRWPARVGFESSALRQ